MADKEELTNTDMLQIERATRATYQQLLIEHPTLPSWYTCGRLADTPRGRFGESL